jgi:Phage integrase, N-terminal SAM-like domain
VTQCTKRLPNSQRGREVPAPPSPQTVSASHDATTATGVSWIALYTRLADDIRVRHASPKTLNAYRAWLRHLQTLTRRQDAAARSSADVRAFLTFLAVQRRVSASTQNQAFTARFCFYRHGLHKAFGQVEGVVRATRKPDVPVV